MNKKFYIFGVSETPLCSFCHTKEETKFHIFFESCETQSLWEELRKYFHDDFSLPILSTQIALFGFLEFSKHEDLFLFDHIPLVFKFCFHKTREEKTLHLKMLLMSIADVKRIEKKLLQLRKRWIGMRKVAKNRPKTFSLTWVGTGW